jgi:hypothetical protein
MPWDDITFCSEEDLALEATGDLALIAPRSPYFAKGSDGVLTAGGRTVSSALVDFAAQGVLADTLCILSGSITAPAARTTFGIGGEVFIVSVDAVGGSITLRNPGMLAGIGQAPSLSALTSVNFLLPSFLAIRKQATDRIRQSINFDSESDLITDDDRRQICVYEVLRTRYRACTVNKDDDFSQQYRKYSVLFNELLDELKARRSSAYATDNISVVPIDPSN